MIRFVCSRPACAPPPQPRLNLGCGDRVHPDWTNIDLVAASGDVMACDLRRPLPFTSGSCEAVYAAHVLEHLTPAAARQLLAEIRRLLRPGGIVRIVVPDLEGIARAYLASLERAAASGTAESRWEHRWMTVELLDQLVRETSGGAMRRWWSCDPVPARSFIEARLGEEARRGMAAVTAARTAAGDDPLEPAEILTAEPASARELTRFAQRGERHRWMYDRISLVELLAEIGFRESATTTADASRIPGFEAACLDTDAAGRPRKPDSLYVEGVRP